MKLLWEEVGEEGINPRPQASGVSQGEERPAGPIRKPEEYVKGNGVAGIAELEGGSLCRPGLQQGGGGREVVGGV